MFNLDTNARLEKALSAKSLTLPLLIGNRTLQRDIDDLAAMVFSGMKLAVVADKDTGNALGERVAKALKGGFDASYIRLEGLVTADQERVDDVRRRSVKADALVAVGSGTINDICKYAAHLDGKPYAVFPTAASMNGYLSANASITVDGYKKTCAATMPRAVFCDLSIIAQAPVRLSKSGLGDSLARPTAQVDWLLSYQMLGTAYEATPFALLADSEPQLLEQARGIARSDLQCVELLMTVLLLSGLGMTVAGGSYPASQAEHMIAHTYEMLSMRSRHMDSVPHTLTLHGEEIAVTSLAMARMQETMLAKRPSLRPLDFPDAELRHMFGDKVAAESKKAFYEKRERIEQMNSNMQWDDIAQQLSLVMLPASRIASVLAEAEMGANIEALGWSRPQYDTALTHARYLRDRFTFLDLM